MIPPPVTIKKISIKILLVPCHRTGNPDFFFTLQEEKKVSKEKKKVKYLYYHL